ncbi:MAG: sensor histidine kinase [Anaerocolumna sp.]
MCKNYIFKSFHFRDLSISKKFTVSLSFLLILPLIVLFLWINQNITSRLDEQNCKTNLEILKQTMTPIHYMIEDVSYISLEILGNINLQTYLVNKNNLSNDKREEFLMKIQYELGKLINSRDSISRVSIFTEEKILFQFGGYLREESLHHLNQVQELRGKPLWLPTESDKRYISKNDRIYEVPIVRAINDFTTMNHIIAYERINIAEEYLCSLYSGIKGDGTQSLFIVNKEGDIISSLAKELLETNIKNEEYFEKFQEKSEGYFVNKSGSLVSYYEINSPQWYVVKIDKLDTIIGGRLINSIIGICILFTMFFGVCFITIQKRQIIEPIKQLSKEVKKFHEGKYNIRLHTDSQDEIGELNQCFVDMGSYIQDLIERVYKSQLKEKESQLLYLQSQINPHFLYNTLDSIRWMAIKGKQFDIAEQIEALSNLFKNALNQGKDLTTLEKEIKHLLDYITIQKNRFGDKIEYVIQVEDNLKSLRVLNLILQPLVENAIVHGLENKLGQGKIFVSVYKKEGHLCFNVEDNGLGTDEELIRYKLAEASGDHTVLALHNINKRIKYKYGEAYGIQFSSEIGVGTKVEIKIPINE